MLQKSSPLDTSRTLSLPSIFSSGALFSPGAEILSESMSTFVPSPGLGIQHSSLTQRCRCPARSHLVRSTRRTPFMAAADSFEQPDSLDSSFPGKSQKLDDSDYIVDIADNDAGLDEDGVNVINVAGDADAAPRKRKRVRENMHRLVHEIDVPPTSNFTNDADEQPPIEDDETTKYILTAVKAADQRKAEDIVALRVSKLTYISSFVVIATGNNTPQLRAIANLVEEDVGIIHNLSPRRVDGVANSGWILLDYGDFLVNIFSPEQRRNYNLEGLWRKAEPLDISEYIAEQPDQREAVSSDASLDDWLSE